MKLTHITITVLVTLLITVFVAFLIANKSHKKEAAALQYELKLVKDSEKECSTVIAAQNEHIEKIRVDTVRLEGEVKKVVTKYSVVRDTIILKLGKDSSCENQINIIDGLLHGFADRMHPQDSRKD
jgi:hypothetical protein